MSTPKLILPVKDIYYGSDGVATRSLLTKLSKVVPYGRIAAELFRAQKASSRAKQYRGGIRRSDGKFTSYRELSDGSKERALNSLCFELNKDSYGLVWGWRIDSPKKRNPHVLYIDLPNGQVNFRSPRRLDGSDYTAAWDRQGNSEARIIAFCQTVLDQRFETDTHPAV